PEATILIGSLLLCILSFSLPQAKKTAFLTTLILLISAMVLCFQLDTESVVMAFGGSFLISKFTVFFKELILLGTIFSVFLSDKYLNKIKKATSEFYMFLLIAVLGGMILVSSRDFITMFVSLETLSISGYILSGFLKEKSSQESMLKYLILGCVASAVMLYGISLLYGISGSMRFETIYLATKNHQLFNVAALAGLFVLSGLSFKLATIPFYNWAPDVYQNSPLSVSAFLSTVSKIAGFGIIIRLISELFSGIWVLYLVVGSIALVSMSIGNFLGLCENNIKRLLAYSSIAHAGYILSVLSLGSTLSLSSAIFYIITYLFMNFAAWSCIELLDNSPETSIDDFKGLAYKRPYLAFAIIISFASLAGLPIFVGFFSKFYLFQAIAFSGFLLYPFLFFILANSLIALYYYLKVIKVMFDEDEEFEKEVFFGKKFAVVFLVSILFTLFAGIFSAPIITYSQQIAQSQIPAVIEYESIEGTFFDNPQPAK
ncbi:MAG: NADH-quinone oxidoreductase subunit N, partial [bacterium]